MFSSNFSEAKAMAKNDAYSGLSVVTEQRHITLPWNRLASVTVGISTILSKSLYHYRNKLEGVPMAFGNVRIANPESVGTVYDDQPFMHLDILVDFVVFFPLVGGIYKAPIVKIEKKKVIANLYQWVSITAPITEELDRKLEVGDVELFRVTEFRNSRKMLKLIAEIIPIEKEEASTSSRNHFVEERKHSAKIACKRRNFDPFFMAEFKRQNKKLIFKNDDDDDEGKDFLEVKEEVAGEPTVSSCNSDKEMTTICSSDRNVEIKEETLETESIHQVTSELSEEGVRRKHKKKKRKRDSS